MRFASDNWAGTAPEVMAALSAADSGATPAYGADPWCAGAAERLSQLFERDCDVYFVATGTAANALALACAAPPWGAVFCHEAAHIHVDQGGAPEFFSGGAKLLTLPGEHGRLAPETLTAALASHGDSVHQVAPAALSLTQPTEAGALYAPEALAALAAAAREAGLVVHMDGARFANAVARLGCAPADISWRAGVDVLTLGATKNGALAAEAVIFFDRARAATFEKRRKRAGQLWSKARYLGAQFSAWLEDDLWLRLARRANAMADRLAEGVAALPQARLLHPVEANILFLEMPRSAHQALRAAGAAYYLEPPGQQESGDSPTVTARLVASFATEETEVARFLSILEKAA